MAQTESPSAPAAPSNSNSPTRDPGAVPAPKRASKEAPPATPRPRTLAAHPWFDIPTRLVILILGIMHARAALGTPAMAVLLPLVAIYAGALLIRVLAVLPAGAPRRRSAAPLAGETTAGLQFPLDAAFILGVTVAGVHGGSLSVPFMVILAGTRFFAWNPGRPTWRLLWPFALPLLVFAGRAYDTLSDSVVIAALVRETMLTECLLFMVYLGTRQMNQGFTAVAELATAVAERDQRLDEAEHRAENDARRLAEQVLYLTVLQNGIAAINSAMALDDLLQMIVTNAVRVLKAEQSSIGLIDEATGELVIQAATGVKASTLRRQRFRPGFGVAGLVMQTGEPLLVGDVLQDPRYVHPYAEDGDDANKRPAGPVTRTILCVPLMVEHRVIGVLSATHSQPNALTQDDQRWLISFAEQAALAVYRTRLLEERTQQSEELRRRGELISSLMSIRQAVVSSLNLQQVLDTAISRIGELIHFDYGLIYLQHPRTGHFELAATNADPATVPDELAMGPDTLAMRLWDQALPTGSALGTNDQLCVLSLPLVNRGKTLGCILLARAAAGPFTEMERDAAYQLASAATIAVDNARLFSSLSKQEQQATALYRLMIKVSDATDRRQLAQVVCEELQHIANARAAALLVHDTDQARFVGWAATGDWQDRHDVTSVVLSAHGDPFVSNILLALQQRTSPDLLVFPEVPIQGDDIFDGPGCVTIPLTMARRIYGLLILRPGTDPAIEPESRELVNLAVSHCTVALERAELFEQTLAAARQSGILHKIGTEVQASLDPVTVVQTMASGALLALPIDSCEVYIFDAERKNLLRTGVGVSRTAEEVGWRPGPDRIPVEGNASVQEVLHSRGLVTDDVRVGARSLSDTFGVSVVLGRLMGSAEPLGIVRLRTVLPAEEFIRRHATFCQTLWMHSGGALERSHLYTTTANQARMLRQRAQQLTDILDLGHLSAADVPLNTLLPQIAAGITRSLGFAAVEIREIDAESAADALARSEPAPGMVPLSLLERMLQAGHRPRADFNGVYIEEARLAEILHRPPQPGVVNVARPHILMPLESTGGGALGYLMATPAPHTEITDAQSEHELLEVLSIFAQRTALIVENHRVYSQLLTSKRKIESVVLSISDGVIVTDEELNIMITNSLADQLLGVPAEESRDLPLHRFIDNAALLAQVEECITTGVSTTADVDFFLGREERTYQAVVHPIAALEMGMLGVVLTLRDVTLERATERAKSDFLSIVSHELRTPLNSIMGFLDIILMGKTGPLTELQQDFLSTAKHESVALHRLINDILDYSQVQSGMLRLEMLPMDLSAALTRVVNHAGPRMAEDQLTLVNDVAPQVLVMGDEVRLEQVFKNLLDNAAKFTDVGGEIRLTATVDVNTVLVSVKDTGCGIPLAQVGHVFDRFFQAENRSNRRKRGLGLGLAICRNIIEAHGGRIWIESEPSVGTTVFIELLLFRPDSENDLYKFDVKTGEATFTRR
jgi:signal transduction histidine kinase/transcriptional regulator with GAF, ATPase, and Fis domain